MSLIDLRYADLDPELQQALTDLQVLLARKMSGVRAVQVTFEPLRGEEPPKVLGLKQ